MLWVAVAADESKEIQIRFQAVDEMLEGLAVLKDDLERVRWPAVCDFYLIDRPDCVLCATCSTC